MIYKYEEVHNEKRKIKEKVKEYITSGPHEFTVTENINSKELLHLQNIIK